MPFTSILMRDFKAKSIVIKCYFSVKPPKNEEKKMLKVWILIGNKHPKQQSKTGAFNV